MNCSNSKGGYNMKNLINKKRVKREVNRAMNFVKDNKATSALWLAGGVAVGAKLYGVGIALNIIGTANYAMDKVIDGGVRKATMDTINKIMKSARDVDEAEYTPEVDAGIRFAPLC